MSSPTSFTLNFGQVAQNTGTYLASFGVQNFLHNATFQDSLGGTFNVSAVVNFIMAGNAFSNVASGSESSPEQVGFSSSQPVGSYSNSVTLNPSSSNTSSTTGLGAIQLTLQGQIIVVPEPSTWVLMFAGASLLLAGQRIRRRRH